MPSDPPWVLGHDNGQTGGYRDPPTTHATAQYWLALASRCASDDRATSFTPPAEEPHQQSRASDGCPVHQPPIAVRIQITATEAAVEACLLHVRSRPVNEA